MSRRAFAVSRSTLFLLLAAAASAGAESGHQGQVWNLGTQSSGKAFPTQVSVFNESCRGAHDFTVAIQGEIARFLSITGPTELTGVRRGETKSTPARLDLTAAPAGSYAGEVVTRCTDCPPTCNLDYRTISVLLAISAPPGSAPRTADTTWQPPATPTRTEETTWQAPGSTDRTPESTWQAPGSTDRTPDTTWQPPAGGFSDPNDECALIPTVSVDWDGAPGGGGPAIVERDGTLVLRPTPSSRTFFGVSQAVASSDEKLATQVRELCLENLEPCEELLAKVRAAEEAYRDAQRRADAATEGEAYDQQEAAALDDETARDRAYAETLRRQAKEWSKLAADARADAKTNRDRAERQPDYAESWNREAARDDARAAERDANAERLKKEADRIESRIRDQSEAAEERRGRAEAARQAAAAAKQALDLARAEYEACLERQRLECERQRREAVAAARRAQAAAAASTTTTTSGGGATAPRGGSTPTGTVPPPAGGYNPYRSLPVRLAPFCEWVHYELPEGSLVDNVQVVSLSRRDTPSALEVRTTRSSSGTRAGSFDYHCKASTGSAVIRWRVDGKQHYQMRVGCVAE